MGANRRRNLMPKDETFDPEVDEFVDEGEFSDCDDTEISMEEVMAKMSGGVPFGSLAQPFKRERPKIGRNKPCLCGSGKKFKKCCEGEI
jgi:preprotein translocase subunit SecA